MPFEVVKELGNPVVENQSLKVDYQTLLMRSPVFTREMTRSAKNFYAAEAAIQKNPSYGPRYRIRVSNMPELTPISELTQGAYEGKIVQFKGIVTHVMSVKKLSSHRDYECVKCHWIKVYDASNLGEMLESGSMPRSSSKKGWCYGKCKEQSYFKLKKDTCVFVPVQRIVLQELISEISAGKTPSKLITYALDDLASNRVQQGEQMEGVGVIYPDVSKGAMSDVFAELISITKLGGRFEEIAVTPQDEERIKVLASNKDVYKVLIDSFAPDVYGYNEEKLALLSVLFGAPRIDRVNKDGDVEGTKLRGDIHCLLAGDPGLAKSLLINAARNISPRGIGAAGKRATGPGLVCSWQRGTNNLPELLPGAMVLADNGGLVMWDEMEKTAEVDRASVHAPMEQQFIDVAMGGTTIFLNTRCSVIGACNPKGGRWDTGKTLIENVNLDDALLSRFDYIFVIRDIPKEDSERKLSSYILETHTSKHEGALSYDFLRKYISYARRINPVLVAGSEAVKILQEGYMSVRFENKEGRIPPTPRILQSLIRVSKALARMQLSPTVETLHASMALKLFDYTTSVSSLEAETKINEYGAGKEEDSLSKKRFESIKKAIMEESSKNKGKVSKKKISVRYPDLGEIVDSVIKDLFNSGQLKGTEEDYWVIEK